MDEPSVGETILEGGFLIWWAPEESLFVAGNVDRRLSVCMVCLLHLIDSGLGVRKL